MALRDRIIIALTFAMIVGMTGCRPKTDAAPTGAAVTPTTPTGPTAPSRTPAMLKALRQAQGRAIRRPRDLQAQLEAGKLSQDCGLYNDAYAAYQRALTIEPENLTAIIGMARANLGLMNPAQGLDWIKRARKVRPNDLELKEMEARLFLLNGQIDTAIAGFRELTRLQPNEPTCWLNLAAANAVARQYRQAIAAARQAAKVAPNSSAAHFAVGRFSESDGDQATAEAEYRAAIKLDAQNAPALIALARLLVKQNRRLDEARTLAVSASQIEMDRADAGILAAWVLHLKGENAKAQEELAKIVTAMPQNAEGWEKFAVVLRAQGREADARRAETAAKHFMPRTAAADQDLLRGH